MTKFQTTTTRALAGLFVGIALCAVTLTAAVVLSAIDGRFGTVNSVWILQELHGLALPALAIVSGICLIGILLWLPFHFLGWRHWSLAMLVGGVVFFVAWFLSHTQWLRMPLSRYDIDNYGWKEVAIASGFLGIIGALVAGAIWRTAYRNAQR